MKYLLSNIEITESEYSYIVDQLTLFFSVDSLDVPNMNYGISRHVNIIDRVNLLDVVTDDVNKFIHLMNSQDINVNLSNLSLVGSKVNVELKLDDKLIKFSVNENV